MSAPNSYFICLLNASVDGSDRIPSHDDDEVKKLINLAYVIHQIQLLKFVSAATRMPYFQFGFRYEHTFQRVCVKRICLLFAFLVLTFKKDEAKDVTLYNMDAPIYK